MMVLVDTSVWSLAFRRQQADLGPNEVRTQEELAELVREGRAQMVGPVRQELLSGIRDKIQYSRLLQKLRAFEDASISTEDYEEAASITNECRAKGISGSAIDLLLCAIAVRRNWPIYTTDEDFVRFAKLLPLEIYKRRVL
jgi:predicted nucleic acid-binding protein